MHSHSLLLVLLCVLATSSSSTFLVAQIDADFLHDGLFYSAPPMKAVDEYKNVCVKPKGDRLAVFTPPPSTLSKIKFHKGSAFLATDLCAMGHTAKDAPLLMSWALDAENFSHDELTRGVFHHQRGRSAVVTRNRAKDTSSLLHSSSSSQNSSAKKHNYLASPSPPPPPPPLRYIIFGNVCMSSDKSVNPNKRTPVFHGVLRDWFRAVKHRLLTLRTLRRTRRRRIEKVAEEEGSNVDGDGNGQHQDNDKIDELYFSDFEKSAQQQDETGRMCFENVVVRHEKWRWLREHYHADQFRIAMWEYFNVSEDYQKSKLRKFDEANKGKKKNSDDDVIIHVDASKAIVGGRERCSSDGDHERRMRASTLAFFAHLQPSKNAVMIRDLEQKLSSTSTSASNNNNHNNNNNYNQPNLLHLRNHVLSLRGSFPSSLLPLRVTVLVRDEDRHFDEKQVAEYIQQHFASSASHFVTTFLDVRQEKFDSIRGEKHYVPPTHKQQLQILFDTDVLIAAHGAGLAAVLVMRPGTAVIEFFPHNFKYYMYEEAAAISRVHYRRWESQIVWPSKCCSVSPLSRSAVAAEFEKPMHLNGLGARACKKCDTYVSPELIDDLVSQALREVAISHL